MEKLRFSVKLIIASAADDSKKGSFGPGIAKLLEGIDQTGSMNQATKDMNMAYSKAWKIIREAEEMLGFNLLERYSGSKGSKLTNEARELLNMYYEAKDEMTKSANKILKKYQK